LGALRLLAVRVDLGRDEELERLPRDDGVERAVEVLVDLELPHVLDAGVVAGRDDPDDVDLRGRVEAAGMGEVLGLDLDARVAVLALARRDLAFGRGVLGAALELGLLDAAAPRRAGGEPGGDKAEGPWRRPPSRLRHGPKSARSTLPIFEHGLGYH